MIYQDLINVLDFSGNIDLYQREAKEEKFEYKLIFFSSLIDEILLNDLQRSIRLSKNKDDIVSNLDNIKIKEIRDIEEAILLLHEGQVILYVNGYDYFILIDLRKIPTRGIGEPEVEKSIRGSKDGFNESLITNISLLRTRIKSNKLKIEGTRIGEYTNTNVCFLYIDDKVDKNKLEILKNKITNIDVESLIMSDRALEELLFNQNKTIFPLVRYTERPDVASIYLMQGHIVLLVDSSSSCIIVPISLFDHFKNVEEYRQNFIVGNFTKILRFIGIFLSIFFLPVSYLLAISSTTFFIENTSAIPLSIQFIIGVFIIELFRIAIIHTPNSFSSALSIVIGIILGEVSMSLGIFMKDVLIVLSLYTISNFSIPSYELSLCNRILTIFYLFVSILFGNIGFFIINIIVFVHLLNLNVLGYPYLYPLFPLNIKKLLNKVFRKNTKNNKKL